MVFPFECQQSVITQNSQVRIASTQFTFVESEKINAQTTQQMLE